MLRVGALAVECRLVKLVALRIWAPVRGVRVCESYGSGGDTTLKQEKLLSSAGECYSQIVEKETKAVGFANPHRTSSSSPDSILFFFSFGSTVAAWKIRRRK
jgi:hypothetical protein